MLAEEVRILSDENINTYSLAIAANKHLFKVIGLQFDVHRVGMLFGFAHNDEDIQNLKLTINGFTDGITSSGILGFTSDISFAGKNNVTILRFIGTLHRPIDRQLWTGTYLSGHFDFDVYVRAIAKLSEDVDDLSIYGNITSVWTHHVDINHFIVEHSKTQLTEFSGIQIFSPGCLSILAIDRTYHPSKSGQGKVSIAAVLSTLYAMCVFTTMRLHFR